MRLGITGSDGFLGWHLRCYLMRFPDVAVIPFERGFFEDTEQLGGWIEKCDVIAHLAGLNRGGDDEIYRVNVDLMEKLLRACGAASLKPHIIFSSSTHASKNSAYGRSKKEAGKSLSGWARRNNAKAATLIFPNIFGEFAKPFYNSAVATFSFQLSRGEKSEVERGAAIRLIYAQEAARIIYDTARSGKIGEIEIPGRDMTVGEVYDTLQRFRDDYFENNIPELEDAFAGDLFSTFRTYLLDGFYPGKLESKKDERGDLFEIVKGGRGGQVFFSSTSPGRVRGNHYHARKIERFCVVRGEAEVRLRRILTDETWAYKMSGREPSFVDMPRFTTHNLKNVGSEDLLTLFWADEVFNPSDPDTYKEIA